MLPGDSETGGLYLSPLPEPPGDPGALLAAAGVYASAHGEIERDQAVLGQLAGSAGEARWIGVGALTYSTVTSDLAACYKLTATSLAEGATALRAYAAALSTAQQTTRDANAEIALVNSTAGQLLAAEATARDSQVTADQASQDAATASAHATANPHSPAAAAAADTAQRTATDAANAATDNWNAVTTLTNQYDSERALALKLSALAQQQASSAAKQAAAAFDNAAITLLGSKPTSARGGAHGVLGNPWGHVLQVDGDADTALGAIGSDAILYAMGRHFEQASDFMDDLPKLEAEWLHEALPDGKDLSDTEWLAAVTGWLNKTDAAESFGQDFLDASRPLGMMSARIGVVLGPVGMFADGATIADPDQSGTMGWVERGVAVVNAGGTAAETLGAISTVAGIDAISVTVPVAGEVVIVGTGLYLAGASLYKHCAWFRNDIANPVGHAFADAGTGIATGAVDAGKGIAHGISDAVSWLGL